jgi:hypothetical protein
VVGGVPNQSDRSVGPTRVPWLRTSEAFGKIDVRRQLAGKAGQISLARGRDAAE